jgi:protein-L-isoaspartate(D-aspartate) O-methyltransferase
MFIDCARILFRFDRIYGFVWIVARPSVIVLFLGGVAMDYQALTDFFNKLDRSFFVDDVYKRQACMDTALPIGFGQTISQPSLVLEMTYRLSPDKDSKVLEIGTGSGFQTALLAEFSGMVYTIERIPELADKAKEKLGALGYSNITYRTGDGTRGWRDNGPYDRIIAAAAAGKIPKELISQLKAGGRMLMPVGSEMKQELMLITKDEDERVHKTSLGEVLFVEFKGRYGWN